MPADPAWGFGAGVDEGSGALEKRIWTATVCKGNKIAIKQGQTEVTHRGLGPPPPPTHSASLTPFSTSSFTHQWVCLYFLKPLDLSSLCPSAPNSLNLSLCSSVLIPFVLRCQTPYKFQSQPFRPKASRYIEDGSKRKVHPSFLYKSSPGPAAQLVPSYQNQNFAMKLRATFNLQIYGNWLWNVLKRQVFACSSFSNVSIWGLYNCTFEIVLVCDIIYLKKVDCLHWTHIQGFLPRGQVFVWPIHNPQPPAYQPMDHLH